MFSKSRPTDTGARQDAGRDRSGERQAQPQPQPEHSPTTSRAEPKSKPPASVLSADIVIKGNVQTSGDVTIEGQVEGDIRAQLLTIGESATVKGEVVAEDVVVNGRIVGRVRGLKVRLTATARVEGDIVHKTIAIESGAHFEGSVMRQDDPLQGSSDRRPARQDAPQSQGAAGVGAGARTAAALHPMEVEPAADRTRGGRWVRSGARVVRGRRRAPGGRIR